MVLGLGGKKIVEAVTDVWSAIFLPIAQAVGQVFKEGILGIWEKVKAWARAAYDVATDLLSVGGADIFDNFKTAVLYVLTGVMCLLVGLWWGSARPAKDVPPGECVMTAQTRAELFCYEKAKSPRGYLPVEQCKK